MKSPHIITTCLRTILYREPAHWQLKTLGSLSLLHIAFSLQPPPASSGHGGVRTLAAISTFSDFHRPEFLKTRTDS